MRNTLDPVLIQLGPVPVTWQAVMTLLALVVGAWLVQRGAKRAGFTEPQLWGLLPWVLILGLIGARLFYIASFWEFYQGHRDLIFDLTSGGFEVYGGILGGVIGGAVYAALQRLPAWRLADAAVPGLLVGQVISLLGSLINGDILGYRTGQPWGIAYTSPNALVPPELLNVPLHPYPAYEGLVDLAILLGLLITRRFVTRDGVNFLLYAFLYSAGRFVLGFFRIDVIFFNNLRLVQIVAVPVVLIAMVVLMRWDWNPRPRPVEAEAPAT